MNSEELNKKRGFLSITGEEGEKKFINENIAEAYDDYKKLNGIFGS